MELLMVGTGSILSDRTSACALVDGRILVDAPNGSMKALRRLHRDPAQVDICLITHFHADHFFDIVFLFLENGLRRKRDQELYVIGPEGLESRIESLFTFSYPESWDRVKENVNPRFVEFNDQGGNWTDGGYRIAAVPVQHTVPIAFGYSVVDNGNGGSGLGFTGDSVYCSGVDKLAEQSSTLVIDSAFKTGRSGHMGLDDVERLADQRPDLRLIATHLSDDIKSSAKENVVIPHDGQVFVV